MTRSRCLVALFVACILFPRVAPAQGLTGALIGTVKDAQGGVLPGALVRVTSPALIRHAQTTITNEKGQLRFPSLPPGLYALDVEMTGFATYHEPDIRIGAGATIERNAVLSVAGVAESVTVQGGSRLEARGSGFETRIGPDYLRTIPTGRFSMFDFIRSAPGISPTSPASSTSQRVHDERLGVRFQRQREPVSHRWHQLHLPVQRRLHVPSREWTSFRKSKSSPSAPLPSSATCRAR